MTTYDPALFRLDRLHGAAVIGWLRIGSDRIGLTDDLRTPVSTSAVTVANGYEITDAGALSLDPSTATATFARYVPGPVEPGTLPLAVTDRVEITYDRVVVFQGVVTAVGCTLQASTEAFRHGATYLRRATYTLRSFEALMLDRVVSWTSLPAEGALTRLRRWLTVNAAHVPAAHVARLETPVPAEESEGSATLLDLARAFTDATGLPLRGDGYTIRQWDHLAVVDSAVSWTDQALTVAPGLTDSTTWANTVDYTTDPATGRLNPTAVAVSADDTRLLGGQTTRSITPHPIGQFVIGTSRIGQSATVPVGFLAPDVIDVLGTPATVARVTHTFGPHYVAALEIAPPTVLAAA